MSVYHLVVSVPPHQRDWDMEKCAACFGITATEMKMKASYQAPEIWFAAEDDAVAEAKYQALLEGGLNVAFTDTRILASIPPRAIVREFEQRKGCISWTVDKEPMATPYQAHAIIVYSKPK